MSVEIDYTLDFALDVAKFYGGLISGGVPKAQAVQITSQYVQAVVITDASRDNEPPIVEPWEAA